MGWNCLLGIYQGSVTALSAKWNSAGTCQCRTWEGTHMHQWTCMKHIWIMWQWAGSSRSKLTQLLTPVVTIAVCPTWKMSHSSKLLPFSSLHYLVNSTESLIIEQDHWVEETTVLPGMQQETQESSLMPPFPSFCLHPVLHRAGQFYLKFLLIRSPPF